MIDANNGVYTPSRAKLLRKEEEEERPRVSGRKLKRLLLLQEGPMKVLDEGVV
jgi:hypothetical protein